MKLEQSGAGAFSCELGAGVAAGVVTVCLELLRLELLRALEAVCFFVAMLCLESFGEFAGVDEQHRHQHPGNDPEQHVQRGAELRSQLLKPAR